MKLVITINERALSKAPLDPERSEDVQYLRALKRLLKLQNQAILSTEQNRPAFYIEGHAKKVEHPVHYL